MTDQEAYWEGQKLRVLIEHRFVDPPDTAQMVKTSIQVVNVSTASGYETSVMIQLD